MGSFGSSQRVVEQAGQFPRPALPLGGEQRPHRGLVVFQRHVLAADPDAVGVVDRVERQPRGQGPADELSARVVHLQYGRGRDAQLRRQNETVVRLRRRGQAGGERRAEAVAAVVVLEALHFQVHRRHERGQGAPGEIQAGLVDGHVHGAERQQIAPALQGGGAFGAFAAEHLGQRQVVEVRRVLKLRAVRAWLVGIAGREQHGVGVERRGQQHRLRLDTAAPARNSSPPARRGRASACRWRWPGLAARRWQRRAGRRRCRAGPRGAGRCGWPR